MMGGWFSRKAKEGGLRKTAAKIEVVVAADKAGQTARTSEAVVVSVGACGRQRALGFGRRRGALWQRGGSKRGGASWAGARARKGRCVRRARATIGREETEWPFGRKGGVLGSVEARCRAPCGHRKRRTGRDGWMLRTTPKEGGESRRGQKKERQKGRVGFFGGRDSAFDAVPRLPLSLFLTTSRTRRHSHWGCSRQRCCMVQSKCTWARS